MATVHPNTQLDATTTEAPELAKRNEIALGRATMYRIIMKLRTTSHSATHVVRSTHPTYVLLFANAHREFRRC